MATNQFKRPNQCQPDPEFPSVLPDPGMANFSDTILHWFSLPGVLTIEPHYRGNCPTCFLTKSCGTVKALLRLHQLHKLFFLFAWPNQRLIATMNHKSEKERHKVERTAVVQFHIYPSACSYSQAGPIEQLAVRRHCSVNSYHLFHWQSSIGLSLTRIQTLIHWWLLKD